jgi:hypothetical protein
MPHTPPSEADHTSSFEPSSAESPPLTPKTRSTITHELLATIRGHLTPDLHGLIFDRLPSLPSVQRLVLPKCGVGSWCFFLLQ